MPLPFQAPERLTEASALDERPSLSPDGTQSGLPARFVGAC